MKRMAAKALIMMALVLALGMFSQMKLTAGENDMMTIYFALATAAPLLVAFRIYQQFLRVRVRTEPVTEASA